MVDLPESAWLMTTTMMWVFSLPMLGAARREDRCARGTNGLLPAPNSSSLGLGQLSVQRVRQERKTVGQEGRWWDFPQHLAPGEDALAAPSAPRRMCLPPEPGGAPSASSRLQQTYREPGPTPFHSHFPGPPLASFGPIGSRWPFDPVGKKTRRPVRSGWALLFLGRKG